MSLLDVQDADFLPLGDARPCVVAVLPLGRIKTPEASVTKVRAGRSKWLSEASRIRLLNSSSPRPLSFVALFSRENLSVNLWSQGEQELFEHDGDAPRARARAQTLTRIPLRGEQRRISGMSYLAGLRRKS